MCPENSTMSRQIASNSVEHARNYWIGHVIYDQACRVPPPPVLGLKYMMNTTVGSSFYCGPSPIPKWSIYKNQQRTQTKESVLPVPNMRSQPDLKYIHLCEISEARQAGTRKNTTFVGSRSIVSTKYKNSTIRQYCRVITTLSGTDPSYTAILVFIVRRSCEIECLGLPKTGFAHTKVEQSDIRGILAPIMPTYQ